MDIYNSLKILHILSAASLIAGMGFCIRLWQTDGLKVQHGFLPLPFAFLQLVTGFTMISLKHYSAEEMWIKFSAFGFIVFILAWFGFIYFLFLKQTRKLQTILLSLCIAVLLIMIFFMANKL